MARCVKPTFLGVANLEDQLHDSRIPKVVTGSGWRSALP